MKTLSRKIIVYIMALMLVTGTINVFPATDICADEFDGDITENPFAHLFKDDDKKDDVVIDDMEEPPTTQGQSVTVTKNDVKKALKTSIKSATKQSKNAKKARIVLKKITKLKGVRYQIKYATNKKLKKAKVKTFKKNKITLKKLKAKKRYYVKARAYVKDNKNKKIYGKWTKRKQIRIKRKK